MANIPISSFTAAANTTGIGMSGFSLTGSNAQSIIDLAATWNTSGTPTGVKLNVTDTASNAASLLMDLQVGGSSKFNVTKNGAGVFSSSVDGGGTTLSSAGVNLSNARSVNFSGTLAGTVNWGDLFLARDATNTLAQRNGVNAQTSRIYNTYTDASNYERLAMRFTSNAFYISSERAGTGTQRSVNIGSDSGAGSLIRLNVDGSINFFTSFVGGNPWNINTSGHFIAGVDNTYDIGASGANRPKDVWVANQVYAGNGLRADGGNGISALAGPIAAVGAAARIELAEVTAPTAAPANRVRIYAEDNGSGKTRVMALFATGAAVQIAIEP